MASLTSKNPKVRERLTQLQKELARQNDVVMDGRDIGTCVLPDADVKVYLTASVEVRAKRRYDELTAKGVSCDIHQIEEDIAKRDEQDMNREIAPLKQAEGLRQHGCPAETGSDKLRQTCRGDAAESAEMLQRQSLPREAGGRETRFISGLGDAVENGAEHCIVERAATFDLLDSMTRPAHHAAPSGRQHWITTV